MAAESCMKTFIFLGQIALISLGRNGLNKPSVEHTRFLRKKRKPYVVSKILSLETVC